MVVLKHTQRQLQVQSASSLQVPARGGAAAASRSVVQWVPPWCCCAVAGAGAAPSLLVTMWWFDKAACRSLHCQGIGLLQNPRGVCVERCALKRSSAAGGGLASPCAALTHFVCVGSGVVGCATGCLLCVRWQQGVVVRCVRGRLLHIECAVIVALCECRSVLLLLHEGENRFSKPTVVCSTSLAGSPVSLPVSLGCVGVLGRRRPPFAPVCRRGLSATT